MNRYGICALVCLLGLPLVSCRDQKEEILESEAVAEQNPVVSTLLNMTKQVQNVHAVIKDMKTQEDATRLLPELVKHMDCYKQLHASLKATPDVDENCHKALQKLQAAFGLLSETASSDAFVELLWANPALQFHLLVSGNDFPCVVDAQTADYILQTQVMETSASAEMRPHVDPIYAEAAQRHADFMAAHAQDYAGGNGSSEAQAIILRPCTEAPEDKDTDEQAEQLMVEYMRHVYPQFRFGFGRYSFTPDGAHYSAKVQFPGLYTDKDGEVQLIKFPVVFCRRLPGKDK